MRQPVYKDEEKLETTFFPPPGLYLAWRSGWRQDMAHSSDKAAALENGRYLFQVWCHPRRSQASLRQTARRLCHPYHLRFLFPEPGNRAVIFTLVTGQPRGLWKGAMQRNVYWWRDSGLPAAEDIHKLETFGFEGLLIDTRVDDNHQTAWQDRMAPQADDLLLISFGAYALQHRWLSKTAADDYFLDILPRA